MVENVVWYFVPLALTVIASVLFHALTRLTWPWLVAFAVAVFLLLVAYLAQRSERAKPIEQASDPGESPSPPRPLTQPSTASLLVAARLLRTELRDIRHKVELLSVSPVLSEGFAFPASEWQTQRTIVATQPDLYATLEHAYTEAHRVNEIWRWRRTSASTRLIGANMKSDGVEKVDEAAAEAIHRLDDLIASTDDSGGPSEPQRSDAPLLDEYDSSYQLRQAITGARRTLTRQRRILSDWKLIRDGQLDTSDMGNWAGDAQQRKFLLKDGRFIPACNATDTAFEAIRLFDPEKEYSDLRVEALDAVDVALHELGEALKLVPAG